MFRKIIAFFLLSLGILLPWRLRTVYIEFLGWITQFFYISYVIILKYIIKELKVAQLEAQRNG